MREFKNVLITGGLGFIGSHVVMGLVAEKSFKSITVVDSGTYAANEDLVFHFQNDGVTVYKMNINDPSIVNVLKHHQIDLIINFAAESHVTKSINGPADFITTNIVGTFNLIEMARQVWGDRKDVLFHQVSTDEVFGSVINQSNEASPYNPLNPYAATKASADHIVRAYGNTYGIPFTISHGCNTFGPFQNEEKFIPMMIKNLCEGNKMTLHEGDHIRQWIPAPFHAFAILNIIDNGEIGVSYNINLGDEYTLHNSHVLKNILDCYNEITGSKLVYDDWVETIPDRPGNDHKYSSDNSRLMTVINQEDIEDCKKTVDQDFFKSINFYINKFSKE